MVWEVISGEMVFLLGLLGGGLAELAKWYKLRESTNFPKYSRSWFYWAVTVLLILAGGLLAFVYSTIGDVNALLAINVGASAPLIILGLASTAPPPPPSGHGTTEDMPKPRLIEFLRWR